MSRRLAEWSLNCREVKSQEDGWKTMCTGPQRAKKTPQKNTKKPSASPRKKEEVSVAAVRGRWQETRV